jgi:isochorismate synthase
MIEDSPSKDFNKFLIEQNPFVFFRLPKSSRIQCYFQEDQKLNFTKDFKIDGFIMGTFQKNNQTIFIPSKNHLEYDFIEEEVKINDIIETQKNDYKKSFIDLVIKTKDSIEKGILKKLVVARALEINEKFDSFSLFSNLLSLYPNAMVYYWCHPKVGTWVGASPESLFSIHSGKFQTMALAGTLSYREDGYYSWEAKEKNEQRLVLDSILDGLKKLFRKKEIQCSDTFTRRAGNLVHLCNILSVNTTAFDLEQIIDQLHPTPAVGGIPKTEGIKFLSQNENFDRSFYTGFFGPIAYANKVDLFVNLRCAQITDQGLTLYVGAGITSASIADMEWEETRKKTQTLLTAIPFKDSI